MKKIVFIAAMLLFSLACSATAAGFSFAVYGDSREGHGVHREIVAGIGEVEPAFTFNTGDMVNNGENAGEWGKFFNIVEPICMDRGRNVGCRESNAYLDSTYFPVPGNHDYPLDNYLDGFGFLGGKEWYSFDYENSHFVVLNSNTAFYPFSAQHEWLIGDLENAGERDFIFVFFHHPAYSTDEQHGGLEKARQWLVPVFEHFEVDTVFNGHSHNYQRSCAITGNECNENGVIHIVAGGGGSPLYSGGNEWFTKYVEKAYNYVVVDVGNSEARIMAYRNNGGLMDSVVLQAKNRAKKATYVPSAFIEALMVLVFALIVVAAYLRKKRE